VHLLNKITGRLAVANKKRWEVTGSNDIGTIVVWNSNGYQVAQIKTENGYVHYNRWLWEKHHGTIPTGYNIVKKEGCPEIATLEFLEMITKAENAIRNKKSFTELPQELKEIIQIKNKINKTIKKNDNRNNQ
jgi:TPP-dependent 2-oxoacid decarboxylase